MSNCGFSLHWAGVFAWMASACTGPASSSDSAAWTNRCRCRGLRPSNRELTTATRKCVSLPAGTAWPPLSLRSSRTSGLRACSNLARIAASTGPPAADPALAGDTHARVAMGTTHRANGALSAPGWVGAGANHRPYLRPNFFFSFCFLRTTSRFRSFHMLLRSLMGLEPTYFPFISRMART